MAGYPFAGIALKGLEPYAGKLARTVLRGRKLPGACIKKNVQLNINRMNIFLIAIVIGLVAGLIDVTPMIIMKLEKVANISAFVHYFVLGLIIPFVNWDIEPWIKGIIISFLSALPVMIIVYPKDKKAIIPMIIFAIILGAGIGLAGDKFIG
jgi:hypothetical protein